MPSFDRKSMAALLCALLVSSACDSDDTEPASSRKSSRQADAGDEDGALERWVGDVTDTDVRVAIVADATRARLFFCGGPDSYATATRWFTLDVEDDALAFEDDAWKVSAQLEAASIRGEVEFGGETHAFNARRATRDTLAGLYQGQAQCGKLGLIVQQPETKSPIRAQGACVGPEHEPQQVNPIMPIELEMGEIAVEAPGEADVRVGLRALESF